MKSYLQPVNSWCLPLVFAVTLVLLIEPCKFFINLKLMNEWTNEQPSGMINAIYFYPRQLCKHHRKKDRKETLTTFYASVELLTTSCDLDEQDIIFYILERGFLSKQKLKKSPSLSITRGKFPWVRTLHQFWTLLIHHHCCMLKSLLRKVLPHASSSLTFSFRVSMHPEAHLLLPILIPLSTYPNHPLW